MLNSIVEYYNTYDIPITDVQRVALKALALSLDIPIELFHLDQLTYGEAKDTIKRLHDLYKANL